VGKTRVDIPGKGLIEFEGVALPEGAKYFDAAPFYEALPEDIRSWVLDLRYAWGRERKAPSSLVIRSCDELESCIYADRETLFTELRGIFTPDNPAEVCQEWLTAIQTMRKCAERQDACTWTVLPTDSEVAYFLAQMIALVQDMEKAQRASAFPPGFIENILTATEAEQIRFIVQTADALSS